jgi:hypothetical protein
MRYAAIRVSVVLLVAILASLAAPDAAAQRLNKADARDFQMLRHSISVRLNARVCERNVPEYGEAFAPLYGQWSEKHRAEIARGESLFKDAQNLKDPKRYPYIDAATLSSVERGLAELARPPRATGPTPPDAQTAVACEKLLTFLKQD